MLTFSMVVHVTSWVVHQGGQTSTTEADIRHYVATLVKEANVRLANLGQQLPYMVVLRLVDCQVNKVGRQTGQKVRHTFS